MHDLPNKESLLQKLVWDDYVQRMVERKGSSRRYPLSQTRTWLCWHARQMREHNQTVFYLEHLQPDWLTVAQQRTYRWQAVRLPAIFIGVLVSILIYVFFFGDYKFANLATCLEYGFLGGFLGILWRGSVSEKGNQGEHHHVWRKRLVKRLAISACFGLFDGLGLDFYLSSASHYTPSQQQTNALSYGVVMGLGIFLLQYLLGAPFHLGTSAGKSAPRLWTRFVRFGSAVQGPRALLVALVFGLCDAPTLGPIFGPGAWLSVALSIGLIYALISLALNAQMEDIRPTERLSWTRRSLRRGLFNSRHLPTTVLLTGISMICVGANDGLSHGMGIGLSIGLSYWCLLGLFQGIAQERINNQDRRIANQGMHRSLHNSVIMGIISGAVIGIIGILGFGLILGLDDMLSYALNSELISGLSSVLSYGQKAELISGLIPVLSYGLQLGICGALLISLLSGGLAVLRHFTIRRLLWRSRTFPWKAPQFLDDATARFLLRRVGGGYSFTHRLLLDHLADAEAAPRTTVSPTLFPHPER